MFVEFLNLSRRDEWCISCRSCSCLVTLPIRTLTGTPQQLYPPPSHPWFFPLFKVSSIQNVMFTCWQCSIAATSWAAKRLDGREHRATVSARTPFCVFCCSQLSIRRPATKETRPKAELSLSVSLLETCTRYRG